MTAPRRRGFVCEAYGAADDQVHDLAGALRRISELCFFEASGECYSAGECAQRMAGERSRLYAQLVSWRDGAGTAEQQLLAREVLRDVSGPADLLDTREGE